MHAILTHFFNITVLPSVPVNNSERPQPVKSLAHSHSSNGSFYLATTTLGYHRHHREYYAI